MCFSIFFAAECEAQLTASDSDFYSSAVSNVIDQYHRAIGDQSGLYNGVLYPGYSFQLRGESPFFDSGKPDTGWILYDHVLYKDLPLYYDDLSGLVIIDDNGSKIQLNNKKIAEFSIDSHHFIQLGGKDKNDNELNTAFYEVLYSGNITVLKKRIKKMTDDLSDNEVVEKLITASDLFYIEKDGVIHPAENKKDLVAILAGKKEEMLRFIRINRLKFRKDTEKTILRVAAYYDQISK